MRGASDRGAMPVRKFRTRNAQSVADARAPPTLPLAGGALLLAAVGLAALRARRRPF